MYQSFAFILLSLLEPDIQCSYPLLYGRSGKYERIRWASIFPFSPAFSIWCCVSSIFWRVFPVFLHPSYHIVPYYMAWFFLDICSVFWFCYWIKHTPSVPQYLSLGELVLVFPNDKYFGTERICLYIKINTNRTTTTSPTRKNRHMAPSEANQQIFIFFLNDNTIFNLISKTARRNLPLHTMECRLVRTQITSDVNTAFTRYTDRSAQNLALAWRKKLPLAW